MLLVNKENLKRYYTGHFDPFYMWCLLAHSFNVSDVVITVCDDYFYHKGSATACLNIINHIRDEINESHISS
jgi:hypothetical protein